MKKLKQIVCILCAVFLAGLYLVTLVFAFTDSSQARSWLSASLYATIAVPVFLYAFLLITKLLKNRAGSGGFLRQAGQEIAGQAPSVSPYPPHSARSGADLPPQAVSW